MRTTARLGVCLLAVVITGAGLVPTARAAERADPTLLVKPAAPAVQAVQADRIVTLVTGDRLQVSADARSATRLPSPGRDDIALLSQTVDGHLEVVPADAVDLLNSGVVDRRLFDVTELLESGYDDKHGALPLIVSYTDNAAGRTALRTKDIADDATVVRNLPSVDGTAITVDRDESAALWNSLTSGAKASSLTPGYRKIWLDGLVEPTLDVSVPLIGAPRAWAAGFTGDAVPVGVLDSGIDDTHPDLAGKVVAAKNFTDDPDTVDHVGHGTHVASIITGSGAASDGKYKGVAPGVTLHSGKVCQAAGATATCPTSAILAGMEWAAKDQRLKIVNMSLGGEDTPGIDPIEEALTNLTQEYGTLFVVAAGNGGPIGSPAVADAALAVGATDKRDFMAPFSSRGPRLGDGGMKPDIAAPGVDITAAFGVGTAGTPTGPGSRYIPRSGTSMAAPHVAGAAAILAQQYPHWKAAELKAALMNSAATKPWYTADQAGAGRLDIARAIASPVVAQPASLFFGVFRAPHENHQPITQKVTYHNSGATALTLALAVNATAPPGVFTLSATTVTVPPGGDADVSVTADPRVPTGNQRFTGALVATGAGLQIRTPIGVQKDKETVALTVRYRNRSGAPTPRYFSGLYALNGNGWNSIFDQSGTATVRVEKGTYTLDAKIFEDDGSTTLLNQPKLEITGDTTVEMDARTGKPIKVTMPRPGLRQIYAHVAFTFPTPYGSFLGNNLEDASFDKMYVAQVGTDSDLDGFLADIAGAWVEPAPDGKIRNSPSVYNLAWYEKNRFFNGFTRRVVPWTLATVTADYAANAPGSVGVKFTKFKSPGEAYTRGWTIATAFDLPLRRTEYYNTDDGVQWEEQVQEGLTVGAASNSILVDALKSYKPSSVTGETWNRAVLSPAFPALADGSTRGMRRTGNTITIAPSLLSDAAGHDASAIGTTQKTTVRIDTGETGSIDNNWATVDVPAEQHTYTITQSVSRDPALSPLSHSVDVEWTFASAGVPDGKALPLPISAIRFAPRVDNNTSTLPPIDLVPVTVVHQPGSTAGVTTALTVQASFDDGKTWTTAQVFGTGDSRQALVKRPAGHGTVSLKAAATDAAGNSVKLTVLRAYRY
jgi:subtilisin family serine protease